MSHLDFKMYQLEIKNKISNNKDKIDYKEIDFSRSFPVIKVKDIFSALSIGAMIKSHFSKNNLKILYRGQGNHYDYTQRPSFIRNWLIMYHRITPTEKREKFLSELFKENKNYVKFGNSHFPFDLLNLLIKIKSNLIIRNSINKSEKFKVEKIYNNYLSSELIAMEPILAHYGYKTRWLDLVDNINIAFWFSSIDVNNSIKIKNITPYEFKNDEMSFIFIYGIDAPIKIGNGVYEGKEQRLVDLQQATSFLALRPIIQQAYSFTHKDLLEEEEYSKFMVDPEDKSDLTKFLLCIIEIPRKKILEYLFPLNNLKFDNSNKKTIIKDPPLGYDLETIFPPESIDEVLKSINKISNQDEVIFTQGVLDYLFENPNRGTININSFSKEFRKKVLDEYNVDLIDTDLKKIIDKLQRLVNFDSSYKWSKIKKIKILDSLVVSLYGKW